MCCSLIFGIENSFFNPHLRANCDCSACWTSAALHAGNPHLRANCDSHYRPGEPEASSWQPTSTRKLRRTCRRRSGRPLPWQPTSTRKLRHSRCWMPTAQLSGNPHLRANCDLLIVALVGPFGLATHIYAQIATAGSLCFLLDRLLATHIYAQIATHHKGGIIYASETGNPHLRANCDYLDGGR